MGREAWRRFFASSRSLSWWLDPRSRRPLVVVAVAAIGVVLAPLAADYADVFFGSIPREVYRAIGQGAMIGAIAVGVRRLCRVRPGDRWPEWVEPGASGGASARWVPWALRLIVASLAIPLLRNPDGVGFA